MKKIAALLLGIALGASLVACGGDSETPLEKLGGGGGGGAILTPGDDYNPRDEDQYLYRSVFASSPHKDQWDTGSYGADLDGIWDSSVLPSVFPAQPSSVTEIDRTSYVGALDKKMSGNPPGYLRSGGDEADWSYFYVMFEGTEDTFRTLTEELSRNFECVDDPENNWGMEDALLRGDFHAYSKDWYFYMSYYEDGDWDDALGRRVANGTWGFTLYAIPAYHTLPKQVEGVPLPQFGYLMGMEPILMCYDDGDDDYTLLDYDYEEGRADGRVRAYWSTSELYYYGMSESEADAYGASLIGLGFELTYDSYNSYDKRYEKDGVEVSVSYVADAKYVDISVHSGDGWYY